MKLNPLRRLVSAIGALVFLYVATGLVGGLIPANPGRVMPTNGIVVYVEDNGIHTGIVVPVDVAGVGWDDLVRPEHFRDPRYAGHAWRSFGWGGRDFYIHTPTWSDINPFTVLRSAVGIGGSVMHVDALPEPRVGRDVRRIVLREDEYRRLAAFIRASFAPGAPIPGYGAADVFYPAHGRYTAIRTCNAWTGEALRAAGVRVGQWTPFPVTVMAWLPKT